MFSILLQLFILGVATEGTGGSKLTQLVTDHILLDIHGHMLPAVMDSDGVANESGEDGGAAAPGLEDLLLVLLVHCLDSLEELRGNIRAFLNRSAHITLPPYFSLRRLTMNLLVGFLPLRVL
jgi:hypothetical protein